MTRADRPDKFAIAVADAALDAVEEAKVAVYEAVAEQMDIE